MVENIYKLVSVDVDSYNGRNRVISYHKTVEGARNAMPADYLRYERPLNKYSGNTVVDFVYYQIDEVELLD